jgi:hypothetical protein
VACSKDSSSKATRNERGYTTSVVEVWEAEQEPACLIFTRRTRHSKQSSYQLSPWMHVLPSCCGALDQRHMSFNRFLHKHNTTITDCHTNNMKTTAMHAPAALRPWPVW